MERFDVIIIGAGVSGMVAGYELSKRYPNILIVDKEFEIGGAVSSYNIDGFNIEKYYHHFFPGDLQLLALVKDLKIADKLIWKEAPTAYYFDNKIFDLNTPLEILNCQFLSFSDKLKLGLALLKLKSISDLSYLDNLSARDWIVQNTSLRVYENFFKPLLKSKFGDEPDISAAWLCARIKKRSYKNFRGEKLGYFKGGFQVFLDALSRKVCQKGKILKNAKVEKIIIHNNKIGGISIEGKQYFSDKVITTVGAKSLMNLCEYPCSFKKKLEQVKEQSIICCLLGLKQSLIRPYWLNIKSDTLPFGILIEHNNFVNLNEYHNTRLIYAITYCNDENDAFLKISDGEIINIYLEALEKNFALSSNDLLWWRISRTNEAGLVYRKGLLKLIPEMTSEIEGLYITGMIRSYPDRGINESVKDAQDCVNIIVNQHRFRK